MAAISGRKTWVSRCTTTLGADHVAPAVDAIAVANRTDNSPSPPHNSPPRIGKWSQPTAERASVASRRTASVEHMRTRADLADALRTVLLDTEQAAALEVHGRTDAAVLVPLFL